MRQLRSLFIRLFGLFTRQSTEVRLSQELESHLVMHIEDNMNSGMSPEEARRHAFIKLGGLAQSKEIYRDRSRLPLIETFLHDLRYGARMLRKNPGFSLVAILTLALGIGANAAIFSVVNGVLLRPLPYADPGRLMFVYSTAPSRGIIGNFGTSPPDFRALREQNHSFASLSAQTGAVMNLTGLGQPERLTGSIVSAEYFSTLGVQPFLGRNFLPGEEKWGSHHVVIVSYGFWHSHIKADPDISGKTLNLDGETYNLIGVMPAGFRTQNPDEEIWAPMAFKPNDNLDSHNNYFLNMIGRLKPGVPRQQAYSDLNAIMLNIAGQFPENKGIGADLKPLHESWVGDVRPALLVLLGAVALVLLMACVNLANLLLARSSARQKEIAIRAALGARRSRLLFQFLTESLLISLFGGCLGFALAWLSLELLPMATKILPLASQIHLDRGVLLFTLGISLLTSLLFGLAPALRYSRLAGLNESLKEGGRTAEEGGGNSLRSGLVIGEVALALVLLISSGLAVKSFQRLLHVDAGFEFRGVLTFAVSLPQSYDPQPDLLRTGAPPRIVSFYQEFMERIERIPGVHAAGAVSSLPLQGEVWGKFFVPLDHPLPTSIDTVATIQYRAVAGRYFKSLGIRLLKGRLVDDRDQANTALSVVINQALVRKFWPDADPIGKQILLTPPLSVLPANEVPPGFHPPTFTVVGVVGDAHYGALQRDPAPVVYASIRQHDYLPSLVFTVQTDGDPAALTASIRSQLAEMDKTLPMAAVATMEEIVSTSVAQPRLQAVLLSLFGGLAVVLACVGIYGVMSYSVNRRVSEIGIRMALGASRWDVLTMICLYGLRLTALGLAAGFALAFGLTRLMSKILFGISPTDLSTFAAVSGGLALVAVFACYLPARRATRVDPLVALRYE